MEKFFLIALFFITFSSAALNAEDKVLDVKGHVDFNEVDGFALRIFIDQDPQPTPVKAKGLFTLKVSNDKVNMAKLIDGKKKLRALAVIFPQDSGEVIFDRDSTLKAMIFTLPGFFTPNPIEGKKKYEQIGQMACLGKLKSQLGNLRVTAFEDLIPQFMPKLLLCNEDWNFGNVLKK